MTLTLLSLRKRLLLHVFTQQAETARRLHSSWWHPWHTLDAGNLCTYPSGTPGRLSRRSCSSLLQLAPAAGRCDVPASHPAHRHFSHSSHYFPRPT